MEQEEMMSPQDNLESSAVQSLLENLYYALISLWPTMNVRPWVSTSLMAQ